MRFPADATEFDCFFADTYRKFDQIRDSRLQSKIQESESESEPETQEEKFDVEKLVELG